METLRKLVHRKKDGDRDHPSWRQTCKTWYDMVFYYSIRDCDSSSLEHQEWNPWKDWCQSWEKFQSSQEVPPKSEKRKAATFAELFTIAKLTRDKLEGAKKHLEQKTKVNESLRNQNYILNKKCEELQQQLDAAKQKIVENNQKLEKEVNLKRILEAQKAFLTYQSDRRKEQLEQVQTKCNELEEKLSSLQFQLMESCKHPRCQINIKNDIAIFPDNTLRYLLRPQLENGEGQIMLDPDTIRDIVKRFGQDNRLNVYDGMNWHMKTRKAGAGCPSRTKIWRKLLRKYHVPYEEIDDAPYWDLVVCLSKYENLETGDRL